MKSNRLEQVAKLIAKAAKGVDPKVAFATTKVAAGLGAVRLVDDMVLDKIPGIKDAVKWTESKIEQGQKWLVDNTLGKIPGVGPIISGLHDAGVAARHAIQNAITGDNHPIWYSYLPQHTPFTIPGSFNNKSVQLVTASSQTTPIPSVATINMVRNIITTPYATTSRYSEIYTAIKYARGLSVLPYNVNYIALLFEIGNEMAVQYYRLAKAMSAAFQFTLTKANLPDQIIKSLKLTDLIDNYHEYATLLDQMYNYLAVNMPMLPIMHNKIRQMCLFTAIDSESPAMSTYIQALVYPNSLGINENNGGFFSNSVSLPKNLEECRAFFQSYMNLMSMTKGNATPLLNAVSDVKGSLASVTYVANWRTIKFKDTFTKDKLFLNSLKNADLIPTFGVVGQYQNETYGRIADEFVNASQGTWSNPIDLAAGKVSDVVIRMGSSTAMGFKEYQNQYICCSGSKEIKPFAEAHATNNVKYIDLKADKYRFTNRMVSLDGTEDSEGKVLETLSLSNVTTACTIEIPTEGKLYVNINVEPSMFISVFIDVENGYSDHETKKLMNTLLIPGWKIKQFVYNPVTTWTTIDWMPAIRITEFDSAATYYTTQLWDINGIGLLSYKAMESAIDYITYSLLYPGNVEALSKVDLANKLIDSMQVK